MSVRAASYPHVHVDASGRVRVGETGIAVSQLVAEATAYGWSPAEQQFQHPTLSLAEIHSALAYYWDHATEIDSEIDRELDEIERRLGAGASALRARLATRAGS